MRLISLNLTASTYKLGIMRYNAFNPLAQCQEQKQHSALGMPMGDRLGGWFGPLSRSPSWPPWVSLFFEIKRIGIFSILSDVPIKEPLDSLAIFINL